MFGIDMSRLYGPKNGVGHSDRQEVVSFKRCSAGMDARLVKFVRRAWARFCCFRRAKWHYLPAASAAHDHQGLFSAMSLLQKQAKVAKRCGLKAKLHSPGLLFADDYIDYQLVEPFRKR